MSGNPALGELCLRGRLPPELLLADTGLGPGALQHLARRLRAADVFDVVLGIPVSALSVLDLRGNRLGPSDVAALGAALATRGSGGLALAELDVSVLYC